MHQRISRVGKTSRCLFPTTEYDEERNDNSKNRDKELFERELQENSKKWHYDFVNDCPLAGEGKVKWKHQIENGDWIGEIQNDDEDVENENDAVESQLRDQDLEVDVKMTNETTPSPTPVKTDAPPPVRKRSRESNNNPADSSKRKIL